MRNFAVLGASALVLALGVAQASALPSTEQAWADYVARTSAPVANSSSVDFGAGSNVQTSVVPSTEQARADYVARTSAGPSYVGELRDYRAQPVDQDASQATDQPLNSIHHPGR